MQHFIYKVCPAAAWRAAEAAGTFAGSADDIRDGYIHLSTFGQLPGTLARHFSGQADLVLVAFEAAALGGLLKWEPTRDGQLFPHLYEALRVSRALWVEPLPLDAGGRHVLPKELR